MLVHVFFEQVLRQHCTARIISTGVVLVMLHTLLDRELNQMVDSNKQLIGDYPLQG